MNIGIIGAGNLGGALGERLATGGHSVMMSFSRDEAALAAAASEFGGRVGTPREAVAFADVVVLAVPWGAVDTAIEAAGPLDGKVLWDCTNALKADLSGMEIGTTTSGGEVVQGLAPGARIVKAIPPFAGLVRGPDPLLGGIASGCFMCGDDAQAKAIVRPLLEAIPTIVSDVGPLTNARYTEPASFLIVHLAYAQGWGPRLGLALLSDESSSVPDRRRAGA